MPPVTHIKSDLLELENQTASALNSWASRKLTSSIADVMAHFLLSQQSNHTRAAYARDVFEFLKFCESVGERFQDICEIKERDILLWKENLTQKHSRFENSRRRTAQSSIARKLCTLSSFFDFALKRKLLSENPLKLVKRPRVRRQSHATVLSEAEILSLMQSSRRHLDAVRTLSQDKDSKRADKLLKAQTEWCILALLFTVGMRVSELCQLKLSDVSREGDLIRVHLLAKGGRPHSPLIHPDTAKVLLDYIGQVRAGAASSSPLFPSGRTGTDATAPLHIHRSTVFRIVREAARRAGIERPFSPHGCRATLATQLHLNEVPVVEIQNLLNHAQVTTTQLYLHRVDDLKESAALNLPWTQNIKLMPKRRA